jgi:hypothetical protein
MKLLTLILTTFLISTASGQNEYPSLLKALPLIPWSGLKENPLLERKDLSNEHKFEYLWTTERNISNSTGATKYRVIEKFKQTDGKKTSEEMVDELFNYLTANTACHRVNDNLYSLNIGGFIKRIISNKGLVFMAISRADAFEDKEEYSKLVNSYYITL